VNFVLAHMYHMQYFVPLIEEGNRRGLKSNIFVMHDPAGFKSETHFGMHPCTPANVRLVSELAESLGATLTYAADHRNIRGLTFFGERRSISDVPKADGRTHVVLTRLGDFHHQEGYPYYARKVDRVVMMNRFYACRYGYDNFPNIYGACSKYDYTPKRRDGDYALVFFPNAIHGSYSDRDLLSVYRAIRGMGLSVVVKSRRKMPASSHLRGDEYVEDGGQWPPQSLDLIAGARFVVMFDSSTSEECVMLGVPFVSFHVVGYWQDMYPGRYVFEYDFSDHCDLRGVAVDGVARMIEGVCKPGSRDQFARARGRLFCQNDGANSSRILDATGANACG